MSSSSNHVPPRLTLQSLTNMEDPFSNISASQFRPPYLRHTGLLSISHEHGNVASHARADHRTVTQPIRPEPLRSVGITFSEQETRDYLSQHPTNIQGRQFGPLPLSDQQNSIRNKQGEPSKVRIVLFLLWQDWRYCGITLSNWLLPSKIIEQKICSVVHFLIKKNTHICVAA